MLKLIETVEREVPCDKCGTYSDLEKCECYDHKTGQNAGTLTKLYQVEAPVNLTIDFPDDFWKNPDSDVIWIARYYGESKYPQYVGDCYENQAKALQQLAEALLTAYLAGEDLPGVTVTEILDGSDEEDEYTRARHGERVKEPGDG